MLKVIKEESDYLWGSNGVLTAALVWDTTQGKVRSIVNWGAYIKRGNLYPSEYSIYEFASYKEAVTHMRKRCDSARPR